MAEVLEEAESEQEEMLPPGLSAKEEAFCVHFASIGSETYSHGTKSAEAAGYAAASARTASWKLLRRPKIRERIAQIQREAMSRNYLTTDKVLSDLESERQKASLKGDCSSAIRASEIMAKYLGMLSERLMMTPDDSQKQIELSDSERAECERIAQIRLRQGGL